MNDNVDERFDRVDDRLDKLGEKIDDSLSTDVDEKCKTIDEKSDKLEPRIDDSQSCKDEKFQKRDEKLDVLEAMVHSQRNILRCREYELILPVGVRVPGQGFVIPRDHPQFVRDFLQLASDEKGKSSFLLPLSRTQIFTLHQSGDPNKASRLLRNPRIRALG
jgi:hypothetical protein